MAKSGKLIFSRLFAVGGTPAAFLAPVLMLLFLLASLGHAPGLLSYDKLHAFDVHGHGKLFFLAVVSLFLCYAAHRLRATLHAFGLR